MQENPTAVIFGAGSVGRGFLGQLFSESGYEIVFVDVDEELVNALVRKREYVLRLAGIEKTEDLKIAPVRAINGRKIEEVAAVVAGANLLATAVGARALKAVAEPVAAGLSMRWKGEAGIDRHTPLNIILCENLHDAPNLLRGYVGEILGTSYDTELRGLVGFVPAVIARMSPVPTAEERAENLTRIVAEPYKVLPVDREAFVGEVPSIRGMKAVAPFAAYTERKLYIHNASHAILGYLGYKKGYFYGYEALEDPWIRQHVEKALDEAGKALIKEHNFEPVSFQEHVDYLLLRFSNKVLGDPVERLARDVLRKLAPGDRLVGAARLAEKHGIRPEGLAFGIAAALSYDNPGDIHAAELQKLLSGGRFFEVLHEICGIQEGEQLGRLVYSYYLEFKALEQK